MRACLRTGIGERPEWLEVKQGLRKGCALSSLLFKVILAAVLHIFLVRFIVDEGTMSNLVHLEEMKYLGKPRGLTASERRRVD